MEGKRKLSQPSQKQIIAVERGVPEGGLRPKTSYQRCTNVVPTFFKRCTNVFKTFLKRRYDVFSKRGTSLARRTKNEVRSFWIVFGKAAYAKDALSKFGRFTGPPVPAIPVPRSRGPRTPEENVEIARKRKTERNEIKTGKKTDETTKKTTKQDGPNHDAKRKKRKTKETNEKNGGNEKQHQKQK